MPLSYGSPVAATITLDGLANNANAISSAIDNTTTKYDALFITMKVRPGTVRSGGFLGIALLGSTDGINYADDIAVTPFILTKLTGMPSSATTFLMVNSSILPTLPPYFKFVVRNRCGSALSASSGANTMTFVGANLY